MFNRSLTFEGNDISKEQPAEAERLAGILVKWCGVENAAGIRIVFCDLFCLNGLYHHENEHLQHQK
jgi:hypothetical protein